MTDVSLTSWVTFVLWVGCGTWPAPPLVVKMGVVLLAGSALVRLPPLTKNEQTESPLTV